MVDNAPGPVQTSRSIYVQTNEALGLDLSLSLPAVEERLLTRPGNLYRYRSSSNFTYARAQKATARNIHGNALE